MIRAWFTGSEVICEPFVKVCALSNQVRGDEKSAFVKPAKALLEPVVLPDEVSTLFGCRNRSLVSDQVKRSAIVVWTSTGRHGYGMPSQAHASPESIRTLLTFNGVDNRTPF